MKRAVTLLLAACVSIGLSAQFRYQNPVVHADYSDPDVCRVGEEYWMTASSFNYFPGLPILHSRDLVHWDLVGAALTDYPGEGWNAPEDDFRTTVQHGKAVWAPTIRFHDGWFYIFVSDPDRGIFMVRTQDPEGRWEPPVWVVREKGFIDPCPFWDEDGKAYLSHGCAGSRAGNKSVLFVAPMAPDGTRLLGPSRIVYDGHLTQPTIEGTKFYMRDGKYYIFAPAGGVATGWQTVLRADSPWGPYEERIVMAWADGTVNGPHQGAWVRTPAGEDWFLHFQDKGAYGRIVHLQPMVWKEDGWPVIGEDPDGDGCGQPVSAYRFLDYGYASARNDSYSAGRNTVVISSEVEKSMGTYKPYGIGLEWQYPAVPSPYWHFALPDGVRLYSVEQKWPYRSLWDCPNYLSQKFPAERFTVRAKLSFRPNPQLKERGEQGGFAVMGNDYAGLRLTDTPDGARLEYVECLKASQSGMETAKELAVLPYKFESIPHGRASRNVPSVNYPDVPEAVVWVELDVRAKAVEGNVPDAVCRFSYSRDGKRFTRVEGTFVAQPGTWVGARFGFWCNRFSPKNDAGWLDVTDLKVKPAFDPLEGFLYDEEKVPAYTLPDVLDGAKTVRDWETKRRLELVKLFQEEMYGSVPGKPEGLHFRVRENEPSALDGLATRRQVRIFFDTEELMYEDLILYIPNTRQKPAPAFLGVNFFGNHTIDTDPGIFLPDSLRYRKDFTVDPRGSQQQRWPLRTILERGYAVATFCCEDVVPDADGYPGIRSHYDGYTWGTLAAWGWGLSRALDYLETDGDVDASRVAVFGHSRMGKTAVWAGARDTRFAMVVSNASGCGGAALSRRHYGETVRRINTHFPYWFCEVFHKYGDNEDMLPFDQHELLALIAPRPLYVESGSEDRWSDPRGEFLGLANATPVYNLYGFEGFAPADWPGVEQPVTKGRNGYHIRNGRHEILLYDWVQYLNFADRNL
ncbi:MAG: family 43 glycosylhydrolase [Bacteroidales bacterium]|nr:family 43 glycosylhydrolase [Bacteroidales bacterium]